MKRLNQLCLAAILAMLALTLSLIVLRPIQVILPRSLFKPGCPFSNLTGHMRIVLAGSPAGSAYTSWPMYQHDVRHSGQSPCLGIGSAPEVLWTKQLPYRLNKQNGSGIVIGDDGIAYLAASDRLFAVDSQDGTIKWTSFEASSTRSTPALGADGRIYWGFADSFAAFTNTGQIDWVWTDLSHNWIFGSSPVISDDGTIYFNHDGLWSFTQEGVFRWVHFFGGGVGSHSPPVIGPSGTVYASGSWGKFYAFDPDGSIKWTKDVGRDDQAPAIDSDGNVYVGGAQARLYAFAPDGTQKWVFETDETPYGETFVGSTPAIGPDGTVYFGTAYYGEVTDQVHIYAVDPNGSLKWKAPISGTGSIAFCACAAPAVDRLNRVYVCTDDGVCRGFAPDGTMLWEYATTLGDARTTPLLASNGTILILDENDILHALGDPSLPRLYAGPRPLQFTVNHSSPPITRSIEITSSLLPITWTATVVAPTSWITIPVANGTTPCSVPLNINPSALVTGSYTAHIRVVAGADNVAGSPLVIPVTLSVGIYAVEGMVISGPITGLVQVPYPFTATVGPIAATLPITYIWQATEQLPVTHTGALSDTIDLAWSITGVQVLTVTATNAGGTVTGIHTITIAIAQEQRKIYLPVVLRSW